RVGLAEYVVDHFGGSLSQEILLVFTITIEWTRPQGGRWNISIPKPGTMCDNSHERLLQLWTSQSFAPLRYSQSSTIKAISQSANGCRSRPTAAEKRSSAKEHLATGSSSSGRAR